jgi:hypothetical protein
MFQILRRTERDIIEAHTCSCEVPVIQVRFYLNLNPLNIFSKKKIKFHENPSGGSRVLPCDGGRSDKHDEANSVVVFLFSQFCKCTEKGFALVANRTIRTEILLSDVQHLTALRIAGTILVHVPGITALCNSCREAPLTVPFRNIGPIRSRARMLRPKPTATLAG